MIWASMQNKLEDSSFVRRRSSFVDVLVFSLRSFLFSCCSTGINWYICFCPIYDGWTIIQRQTVILTDRMFNQLKFKAIRIIASVPHTLLFSFAKTQNKNIFSLKIQLFFFPCNFGNDFCVSSFCSLCALCLQPPNAQYALTIWSQSAWLHT